MSFATAEAQARPETDPALFGPFARAMVCAMEADRRHFVLSLPGAWALLAGGLAPITLAGCVGALPDLSKQEKTVFARLTTVETLPGKLEEAIAIFEDEVIPTLKQQKGFHRALLLTHPATAKAVSITLWDSEADQLASETHASFRQQLSKVSVLLAGPPVRQDFVVSVWA